MNVNNQDEWIGKGSWKKTVIRLGGTLHYDSPNVGSQGSKKQPGIAELKRLSKQTLMKNYLCAGKNSSCVRSHHCECLAACKYGQRYLQLVKKELSE